VTGVVVGMARQDSMRATMRWAAEEAALHGLPLRLVHAWPAPVDVTVELPAGCDPDIAGPVTVCATPGPVAAVLTAADPALLVLRRGPQAQRLSAVTRSCLRAASCPIAVVPAGPVPASSRIVVGFCGTEASWKALAWAAEEARRRLALLIVVDVQPPSFATALGLRRDRHRSDQGQESVTADRVCQRSGPLLASVNVERHARRDGPLDGLLAEGAEADLIVVGRSTHAGSPPGLRHIGDKSLFAPSVLLASNRPHPTGGLGSGAGG